MKISIVTLLLAAFALSHDVSAATQAYAAHEESLYTGDLIADDSGGPPGVGNEGDVFVQLLTYNPQIEIQVVEASVSWDDTLEQLVGFTQVTTLKELLVKDTETITWHYGDGAWSAVGAEVMTRTLSTDVFDRSPLLAPVVPADPGGGGGGGGGDPYPTPEQLQEMELAGVPDAACTYLGKCNDYLNGLTRDQYLRDMQAIEAILAGAYNPVPVPAPWLLLASGAGALCWRSRRARTADTRAGRRGTGKLVMR